MKGVVGSKAVRERRLRGKRSQENLRRRKDWDTTFNSLHKGRIQSQSLSRGSRCVVQALVKRVGLSQFTGVDKG